MILPDHIAILRGEKTSHQSHKRPKAKVGKDYTLQSGIGDPPLFYKFEGKELMILPFEIIEDLRDFNERVGIARSNREWLNKGAGYLGFTQARIHIIAIELTVYRGINQHETEWNMTFELIKPM